MSYVSKYWHNDCIIISIINPIVLAINKNRNTIVYHGEWNMKLNLPNGKGKQYKSIGKCDRDKGYQVNGQYYLYGKIIHKGTWNNGVIEGYGHHWYLKGTMYKGNWKDNKPNGYGISYKSNKTIDQKGTWINGSIYNGYGIKKFEDKSYFIGDIFNGEPTENGKYFNKYHEQKYSW